MVHIPRWGFSLGQLGPVEPVDPRKSGSTGPRPRLGPGILDFLGWVLPGGDSYGLAVLVLSRTDRPTNGALDSISFAQNDGAYPSALPIFSLKKPKTRNDEKRSAKKEYPQMLSPNTRVYVKDTTPKRVY